MNPFVARGILLGLAMAPLAPVGAQLAPRCSACHLADGRGVPGAFPSLQTSPKKLAETAAGRRYLVLALTRGLAGELKVEGQTFRGTMPAHVGLDDQSVAATLNALLAIGGGSSASVKAFTPAEVAGLRKTGMALTPAQVAASRPRIG